MEKNVERLISVEGVNEILKRQKEFDEAMKNAESKKDRVDISAYCHGWDWRARKEKSKRI